MPTKPCSARLPPETPGRSNAWTCALINQLATPGLGSIIGRRFLPGVGQLLLAVGGFVLIVGWMAALFYDQYGQLADWPPIKGSYGWLGSWGLALFGAAWLWSLFTSLSLLRQAKAAEPTTVGPGPPSLDSDRTR